MKKLAVGLVAGAMTAVAVAQVDVVSSVSITEAGQGSNRRVNVSYVTDKPAIVTFSVTTNGAPVDGSLLSGAVGDIFKKVPAGSHSFTWAPRKAFAERFTVSDAVVKVSAWSKENPPDYVVFDLSKLRSDVLTASYYECAEQIPGGVTNDVNKGERLVMRRIPAALEEFPLGATDANGRRMHVKLSEDFYMGVYMLCQRQVQYLEKSASPTSGFTPTFASYVRFRGSLDAWPRDGHAVSEQDACYIYTFRQNTGLQFDLPSEAQWEFACRAREYEHDLYTGKNLDVDAEGRSANLDEIAWYGWNSLSAGGSGFTVNSVGLKKPNAFGLYDMLGLAWEFCLDSGAAWDPAQSGAVDASASPGTPQGQRLRRGGAFDSTTEKCTLFARTYNRYDFWNDSMGGGIPGFGSMANQCARLVLPLGFDL